VLNIFTYIENFYISYSTKNKGAVKKTQVFYSSVVFLCFRVGYNPTLTVVLLTEEYQHMVPPTTYGGPQPSCGTQNCLLVAHFAQF
jgi:hypothetical protein